MSTTPKIVNGDSFYQPGVRAAAAADLEVAAFFGFLETFIHADENTRQAMFQAPMPWNVPHANPPQPPFSSGPARDGRRPEAGTRSTATESSCVRCGSSLTPNGGMLIQGTVCNRCYLEVPYSTERAWQVQSEERVQASLKPPVVRNGIPFLSGAVPTERDGWCWTCGASTPTGHGEVVWEPIDQCQHALCTTCVWRLTYDGLWPALTPEQAVAIAVQRVPLRVLAMAAFLRGYTADAVVGGAITEDIRASLSADADAFDAAGSQIPAATNTPIYTSHLTPEVRVGTDTRPYPYYLPPELVGWHEYVLGSGHCVHAVLAQRAAEHDDEELMNLVVPLPVGVFARCPWELRAGFVIVQGLTYDDPLGVLDCLPSDGVW